MRDYLLEAKELEDKIKLMIKSREFNQAWITTQELSDIYVEYVNSLGYYERTPDFLKWANSLLNSPYLYRAEIRSKEGKHRDALFHGAWRAVTEHRPVKKYEKKMLVYLRRSKLCIDESEFLKKIDAIKASQDIFELKQFIENLE